MGQFLHLGTEITCEMEKMQGVGQRSFNLRQAVMDPLRRSPILQLQKGGEEEASSEHICEMPTPSRHLLGTKCWEPEGKCLQGVYGVVRF